MYTKADIADFKKRGIKKEAIDNQLENFQKGFGFVQLCEPATPENGIKTIPAEEEEYLIDLYENGSRNADVIKMVPASGSATRMFKALFHFIETYRDDNESFLTLIQNKQWDGMRDFFLSLNEYPFYEHLKNELWKTGKKIDKMLEKREYREILEFLLTEKGLNYGNTPKGLIDFHIYRDFVRTPLDEHLVEGALYGKVEKEARLHFTVSEEHLPHFKARLKKICKVFEKKYDVKYDVSFSIQKPATDTVSIDEKGAPVRDEKGHILFRPGGHGALIHNLNDIKADIIFIKNIDNVLPDRSKGDTVKYKKLLAGTLLEMQSKIFERLDLLIKRNITDEQVDEIEHFLESQLGYKKPEGLTFTDRRKHIRFLFDLLNRPVRVCGMVRNEGEPGGGPFWVKAADGSRRLMIIESAQIDPKDKEQKKIFDRSTHFNPVDLVCGTKNYRGKRFDLLDFIDHSQGFITEKSYHGKEIRVQELPGLWNGAMANWITLFVEVPLSTFSPVKTVFDLRRTEHRNVFFK